MKYIKSFLSILLCLLFVFAFASCGEKKNETEKTEQKTVQQINYTEKWIVEPSIKADNINHILKMLNDKGESFGVCFIPELSEIYQISNQVKEDNK